MGQASFKKVLPCREANDRKAKLPKFEQSVFKFLSYLPRTALGPHHYLLLSPQQTCGQGNLPFFEKEKEEKIKIWSLTARYCLPGVGAAQSVR